MLSDDAFFFFRLITPLSFRRYYACHKNTTSISPPLIAAACSPAAFAAFAAITLNTLPAAILLRFYADIHGTLILLLLPMLPPAATHIRAGHFRCFFMPLPAADAGADV